MDSIEKLNKEIELLNIVLKSFMVIALIIIALYSFYAYSILEKDSSTINHQPSTISHE